MLSSAQILLAQTFERCESSLPGNVQWKIDARGGITGAFWCPWLAGCKGPPHLRPGRAAVGTEQESCGGQAWRGKTVRGS